jgi:hypothetical protein
VVTLEQTPGAAQAATRRFRDFPVNRLRPPGEGQENPCR